MMQPLTRRALLGSAAAIPAVATLPQVASASTSVGFDLNATVLDGGEQVTSLTIRAGVLGQFDPSSLTLETFSVLARAESPLPASSNQLTLGTYDVHRDVTAARVDNRGNITLELATAEGVPGGATLGYTVPAGRNVEFNLTYTITQNAPLRLRNQRQVTIARFVQGELTNPEVDAFSYGTSISGLNYRLFSPRNNGHGKGGKHPLIVWLHGGGEGGMGARQTNEAQLRGNRGAVGFVTPEAQQIFGGAYVVAPQSPSAWMTDGDGFAPKIAALVDELLASNHKIDPQRVHVLGCSNGGYMSLKMAVEYPEKFASVVPICPGATPNFFTDAELQSVGSTPTWLVHSKDDTVLPWEPNSGRAAALIDDAIVTLYDTVTWQGHQFMGHWSWIYVARNDPQHNGQHIWQWMAQQHR
ncbi:prolyl oligopeptidase family serine peptidase [Tessaracoccus sp. MC1865]|uniref:prolyl oligopeptidase family serine peptidase n=1 Tax=Tessaracoccus sp. MC1865 TaxID=2760310 RepID=UPI001602EED3|nr:PHB depolymerase family esterase [Tessaracoccus sp. MC1865]MBB1482596.1 prolyl oligopeptidase family serine peptidase [Tessaracoccus sp. MC1865]QTO37951.1 prolyl oligopeptidase family serine peptidase [Tessaracoccus sp. MC1865]